MNKFSKKNLYTLGILPFLLVILLTSCTFTKETIQTEPLKRTEFALGTVVNITLYDHQSEEILDKAFNRIKELEDTLSINKTDTLIDEVNNNAGISPVIVDSDTFKVIQKGLSYSNLTNGSFDITVGPLVKLWSIGFPEARVPSQSEIDSVLPLIDYNNIILDEATQSVFLKEPHMLIDLGGIGKGYAADEVASLLRSEGVEHAIIDLGGNIYTLGNKPGNKLWSIGIQDPTHERGNTIGYITVANKSVVTSGIYERYLEENGIKYHHILDPETGYPFENNIAGVTIISEYSTDGDAISTSVFSKGIEEGLRFVESLDGIDAIFISKDGKIYLTSGASTFFTLTNESFEIVSSH